MNYLSNAPFIRILPAFCVGIIFSFYNLITLPFAIFLFGIGVLVLVFLFSKSKPNFKTRRLIGVLFQFIYFSLGFGISEIRDDRNFETIYSNLSAADYFTGDIEEIRKGNDGNLRSVFRLLTADSAAKSICIAGKCYLYFKNDPDADQLSVGDRIVFKGNLELIDSPVNPGQYNFRKRSAIHRIYHSAYLKQHTWKKIPASNHSGIKGIAIDIRNKLLSTYKMAGLEGQEYAVLSALVLGYEDEIDGETMKAFSASGTLHVLSVSGMHVGIIFTALSALLGFLGKNKTTRSIRLIILLLSLWFYAMLTGLSPSVIRSAMMFSFILVGKSLNRSSNIYNSLALSAFCIFILFDPFMLMEVGLQLSYLAVAGIAWLYPKIYKLIFCKSTFIDKIWSLIAVSIAAQAATFSLSIFYFHQFPNYFIPANLLIIPLSTIGIFAGIFLLFLSPFPYLCLKAGFLVKYIIYLLNASAIFIENLPGAVWQGISIGILELMFINFILFAAILFFENKSIRYLYAFLFSIIILSATLSLKNYLLFQERYLTIFSNSGNFCWQLNNGFDSFVFYHSIDSAKACRFSSDLCLSSGLPLTRRRFYDLDKTKDSPNRNIFIFENFILVNDFLMCDYSKKTINNLPQNLKINLIYTNNYYLKNIINENIKTDRILINGRKGISTDTLSTKKHSIHYLIDSAVTIDL